MTTATAYEVHPLAHLLPEMRDEEYAELRDDIAANGLHEAITLYEEKVLDGRHRYRACEELGGGAHYIVYEGDEPAAYVLSLNVKRRQLTQSQKAMLATDFLPHLKAEARSRQGSRTDLGATSESSDSEVRFGRSAAEAADQVGVGHAQVIRANKVKREDPELAESVRNGEVSVWAAYTQVTEREKLANRTASLRGEPRKIAHPPLASERGQVIAAAHKRRLIELISSLTGYSRGLENIDAGLLRASMEQKELDEWARQMGDALTKFRAFRTDLRKGQN